MASAGVRFGVSTTKSSSFTFVVGTVVVGVIVGVGALIGVLGAVFITLVGKVVVGFVGVVTVLTGVGVTGTILGAVAFGATVVVFTVGVLV